MFVVKKHESANKTIRMSTELIERLETLASQEDISFNRLVVQCCEYALAHLNQDDPAEGKGPVDKG